MHLGAGEVLEGRSVAAAREESDVDLKVVAEGEADFVLAFGEEFVDERESGYVLDCSRDDARLTGGTGNEKVEVAYGLASSAERAGGSDFIDAGEFADEIGDDVGVVLSLIDAEAAGVFSVVFDALEEFGDKFFAHAGKFGEVSGFGGGFEGVDVTDLARGPDESHGFGTHAGEAQELEHGGFVFLQELFTKRKSAGRKQRLDVGEHAFADARDG